MVLILLCASLVGGSLIAGALPEYEDNGSDADVPTDVQPVDVPETEEGIMAISGELDAEMAATLGGPITPFESMIYKVMQSHGSWIVIVGGDLAENMPLPATIEIAVPADAPVFWFGEVGNTGDPAQDPRFPQPWQFRTEGDFDIYTATMTQYHRVQIEYRLNDSPFSQGPDGPSIHVEYTPLQDLEELRLAVALPAGGAVLARDVQFLGMGPGNEPAFARIIENAQAGELYSTEITYTITAGGNAITNLDGWVVIVLAALLFGGAALTFWLFIKTRNKSAHYDDDWSEDESVQEDDDSDNDTSEDVDDDRSEASKSGGAWGN
ncbi:MAG: hypothetical protein FWC81_00325 [Coriobacteriia bacterium]|nr:hypothetical protein [Coriobacteriia bacterium]MCL2606604.1 hypothetical protein [Coriobacteriia bacterium]